MTDQPTPAWHPPEPVPGPAPGLEFGGFGPRLVAYIIDAITLSTSDIPVGTPSPR